VRLSFQRHARLCALGDAVARDVEIEFPIAGHMQPHPLDGEAAIRIDDHFRPRIHAMPMRGHISIDCELDAAGQRRPVGAVEHANVEGEHLVGGNVLWSWREPHDVRPATGGDFRKGPVVWCG
jgi:hypothetical protein